jgi:hypothetical protein
MMPDQVTTPNTPNTQTGNQPAPGLQAEGEAWRNVDEVKQIIKQRDEFKSKAREQETRLSQLESAERDRQARDEQARTTAEQEKLKNEGKYREALELSEKKWKGQVDVFKGRAAAQLVPLAIQGAAAQISNLTPEAMKDLPSLLERQLSIDAETLEVYPVGLDGKRLVDETLKPISVEQYVSKFVSSRPYLLRDQMPVSHGAVGGASKGKVSIDVNDEKAMQELAERDPEGYKAAVSEQISTKNLKMLAVKAVADKARQRAGG